MTRVTEQRRSFLLLQSSAAAHSYLTARREIVGKPTSAGRKGQIEPIGRTPMNVRYTSNSGRLRRHHCRRCRCRRAAGCRPMLLAIPPFKSARARAIGARMSAFGGCSTTSVEGASAQGDASLTPVQAPKTASLLVSRPWPWTCAVATSSTSVSLRRRPPGREAD